MARGLSEGKLQYLIKTGTPVSRSDGDGLTFTVSAKGTAAWVLRYRHGGRAREYTIGRYPDIDRKKAHNEARELRVRIARGEDVAATKRATRLALREEPTFSDLATHYMEKAGPELSPLTRKDIARYLAKDILPRIGPLRASSVGAPEVRGLVTKVAERSRSVAQRTFEIVSVIFSHSMGAGLVKAHPLAGIKISNIIGKLERKPRVQLTREELRTVWALLPGLGEDNALAIKILLATCVRKSELLQARKEEVDLDNGLWRVPADRLGNKRKRAYSIPLPPAVVDWFRRLFELAGSSDFVLPGRAKRYGEVRDTLSRSTLNVVLDRLDIDVRRFTPHDLRSTARSYLGELGVPVVIAERCLNHKLGGLLETYDRSDYLAERRDALGKWVDFLENGEKPASRTVVPLPTIPTALAA